MTRTVTVEVPTPVVVRVDEKLTAPCEPRFLYPPNILTVGSMHDKIEALEIALAMCNNDKALIRATQ